MAAKVIVAIGSRSDAATSSPGLAGTLTEAVEANKIAMHDPAPISAASEDTPTTSFGRMRKFPLSEFFPTFASERGHKNAAKNTTGVRGPRPQFFNLILTPNNFIQEQNIHHKC